MSSEKPFFVYIMTNPGRTVLHTGATSDLSKKVYEHETKTAPGPVAAITREKQIEAGSKRKKVDLITGFNPTWRDLSGDL